MNSTVSMNVRLNNTKWSEMAKSFKRNKRRSMPNGGQALYMSVCDVVQ